MRVTVHAAKANLSELVDAALNGEEVFIDKEDKLAVRLVPVEVRRFRIGILEGADLGAGPDWFEPMSEEELRLWEGGDEISR